MLLRATGLFVQGLWYALIAQEATIVAGSSCKRPDGTRPGVQNNVDLIVLVLAECIDIPLPCGFRET